MILGSELDAERTEAARAAGEDVAACLRLAAGLRLPQPGGGATAGRWAALAGLARVNLTAARVAEAHTDALAILAEAGTSDTAGTWGVFAAEAPRARLEHRDGALHGDKPWCSLGDVLDHALVTALVGSDERQLFRVDLQGPGVRAEPAAGWVARGLRTVTSVGLHFDGAPAEPVGGPGWYLRRDGFAWGGMGVAACWYGGAQGVADRLRASSRTGELADAHLGEVEVQLHAAGAVLGDAAAAVDAHAADGTDGALLALRVRAVVAAAAERVLTVVGHALGPAPLAFDAEHAARVADLGLYLRQHHGERDLAALGAALR